MTAMRDMAALLYQHSDRPFPRSAAYRGDICSFRQAVRLNRVAVHPQLQRADFAAFDVIDAEFAALCYAYLQYVVWYRYAAAGVCLRCREVWAG